MSTADCEENKQHGGDHQQRRQHDGDDTTVPVIPGRGSNKTIQFFTHDMHWDKQDKHGSKNRNKSKIGGDEEEKEGTGPYFADDMIDFSSSSDSDSDCGGHADAGEDGAQDGDLLKSDSQDSYLGRKARHHHHHRSNHGCLRRWNIRLNYHGQLVMLGTLHAMAILGVWAHFAMKKWEQRRLAVPKGAPNHWQKRIVPSLEFGAMHALLVNLGLLPLVMCRYTWTKLRSTWVARFWPFDYMTEIHKYLGYVTGVQLAATVIVFIIHFSKLCADYNAGIEKEDHCEQFFSEIMLTGYAIVVCFIIMFVSSLSYFRDRKDWNMFYYVHHFFLAFYGLTLAHTFDIKQREGLTRSQNWKFLVGPLVYYTLDRFMFAMTTKKTTLDRVVIYNRPESIVMQIRKPEGWTYRSGQYLFLNVPELSKLEWHPYSIASIPEDHSIKLCVQIEGDWGRALHSLLLDRYAKFTMPYQRINDAVVIDFENDDRIAASMMPEIMIMGPSGSPSQNMTTHDHIAMICAGSGVVPMISSLRMVYNKYRSQFQRRKRFSMEFRSLNTAFTSTSQLDKARRSGLNVVVTPHSKRKGHSRNPSSSSEFSVAAAAALAASPVGSGNGSSRGSPKHSRHNSGSQIALANAVVNNDADVQAVAADVDDAPAADVAVAADGEARRTDFSNEDDEALRLATMSPIARFQKWAQRFVVGTRYSLVSLLLMNLDLAAAVLTVSFLSNDLFYRKRQVIMRDITTFLIVAYAVESMVRLFMLSNEKVYNSAQKHEWFRTCADCAVALPMVLLYIAFYDQPLAWEGTGLFCLIVLQFFAWYRIAMRWYLNPLALRGARQTWLRLLPHDHREMGEHGIGVLKSVHFLWVCRHLSTFEWLFDELKALQHKVDLHCPEFIHIRVHITDPHADLERFQELLVGTSLEKRVHVSRPHLKTALSRLHQAMEHESVALGREIISTGVFFSGDVVMEGYVQDLCLNYMNSLHARFLFHSENSYLQWSRAKYPDRLARRQMKSAHGKLVVELAALSPKHNDSDSSMPSVDEEDDDQHKKSAAKSVQSGDMVMGRV
eukprot:TRINITY_DN67234_c4_g2_i1.p1 TRINITY_DN67234_c4_g2~~TRINITY_DN67234_c4_g2_i1.p1  ORF type:complete len:1059 (+),score=542.53 TRINITY_DN67234_c4_g2_i1:38-3214(+)